MESQRSQCLPLKKESQKTIFTLIWNQIGHHLSANFNQVGHISFGFCKEENLFVMI